MLCFLVSTCYFNSVIQSDIMSLFCYSAHYRYFTIYRYSAILRFHSLPDLSQCWLVSGTGYYYTLLVFIHLTSNYWYDACMCIASMPFVFSCSPQEVLCYRNVVTIMHPCLLSFYAPPNGYCADVLLCPFSLLENFENRYQV